MPEKFQMLRSYTKIGEARKDDGDPYYFFTDKVGAIYMHDEEERLLSTPNPYSYQVKRMVSRTVFCHGHTRTLRFEGPAELALLSQLKKQFSEAEDSFLQFVQHIEKTMVSNDLWKFVDCAAVTDRIPLKNFALKLGRHPQDDVSYYLIEAKFYGVNEHAYGESNLFLQIISKSIEGIAVCHQELTHELFALANLTLVRDRVKQMTEYH